MTSNPEATRPNATGDIASMVDDGVRMVPVTQDLIERLRRGMMASAGFVRDSKNPEALHAMMDALDAFYELDGSFKSALRG